MLGNISYSIISFYELSGVVISGTCVGTYGTGNYIVSPNYPQAYDNYMDCRWLISNPGRKDLTLKFLDFELRSSDDFGVYHGENIHGTRLNHCFTCTSPIVSSGKSMYLRFTSGSEIVSLVLLDTSRNFKIEVSGK